MSVYYQNVRGLRTKSRDVFNNSQTIPSDIFALTETNLTPSFYDNELFVSDYSVFRKDGIIEGSDSSGRGVLIAVHSKFDAMLYTLPNSELLELVCVKISLHKHCLYILCCYIKPGQPTGVYQNMVDVFDHLFESIDPCDNIIILGDFNLPDLQWEESDDGGYFISVNSVSEKEMLLTDRLSDLGLHQVSNVKNNLGRQLDLVFSTDVENCVVTESNHLLSTLDHYHPPLSLAVCYENENIITDSEKSYKFNFHKADFGKLNDLLSRTNFDFISDDNINIDIITDRFYLHIFSCFFQSIPYLPQKNVLSSPPWYTRELRSLRNHRNKLWHKFLTSRLVFDYSNYLTAFNNFATLCNSLYSEYIDRMQFELISDPKCFFKFINSKRKTDGYPSTMKLADISSPDPKIITNMFVTFFSKAFSDSSSEIDVTYFNYMRNCAQTSLTSIHVSPEIILEKIQSLKDDYSSGPDGLPAIVLKNCASPLIQPLTALFRLSISRGIFPKLWKDSYIIPIHKNGSKNEISNYRPIAKLSCIPKLFENIVYDSLFFHCKSLFSSSQHGFLKGRSTTTNLTEFVSKTVRALENGNEVDVVATDFSKAFDKVSHPIILFKLKELGFQPLFIKWVESYLKDRQYKVLFRSCISNAINATSGVPQGSHIGPLLFILTINDVEWVIKKSCLSVYADDMKIYREISSPSDSIPLQEDLNRFAIWCQKNCLELNIAKCQTITHSRKRLPSVPRDYLIGGAPVGRVSLIRDLGVLCDRELDFRPHIDSILCKANSALGFVKRWSKEFSNPYVTKSLFVTFVRPLLEYASQVWSPYHKVHIMRIEAVQRRFIRFALRGLGWADIYNLPPYEDRLKLINLQPLHKRRVCADIVFVHQLLAGNIDSSSLLGMFSFNINHRSLRSIPTFRLDYHRTDYGQNEPITRMSRNVNNNCDLLDFNKAKSSLKRALYHT